MAVGVLLAVLACASVADASGTRAEAKRKHSAKLTVSAKAPAIALAGKRIRVRGRVRGSRRGLTVILQRRVGRRWRNQRRARSNPRRKGRFRVAWTTPRGKKTARLRVVAREGRKRRAKSKAFRIGITRTKVLKGRRIVAAPPPGQAGKIRYRGKVAARRGEYVAVGASPKTPSGLLARVAKVRRGKRSTVLTTVPASIVEAVPAGHFAIGRAAAAAAAKAQASEGPRPFGANLSCTGGATGQLTGSLSVSLDPRFSMSWGFSGFPPLPHVNSAEAAATLTGQAAVSAEIAAEGSCTLAPTPVLSWNAPTIKFAIGGFPVVIVPRTTVYVSATAEANGKATAAASGQVSATAGLRLRDGQVHPVSEFVPSFTYSPLTARVSGTLDGRVIPSVVLLMYGVAGPRFDLSTGLRLHADTDATPWWTLGIPVELTAQLVVPHFDQLNTGKLVVFSHEFPLAQADTDPPPPVETERARITWDTDDTDVDLHIWDQEGHHAWYGETDGIPDSFLLQDIINGYGPEIFFDRRTPSRRQLTFGLCYYSDHENGPSNVTATLIDPDGTRRTSVHHLAESKDSVLLGSSPPGGYVPPPGWCE